MALGESFLESFHELYPVGLCKQVNFTGFLFLKNRFYDTLSRDHIVVTQTGEDIYPLHQSGDGREGEAQGIVLSGWLYHHLAKAKVINQV